MAFADEHGFAAAGAVMENGRPRVFFALEK